MLEFNKEEKVSSLLHGRAYTIPLYWGVRGPSRRIHGVVQNSNQASRSPSSLAPKIHFQPIRRNGNGRVGDANPDATSGESPDASHHASPDALLNPPADDDEFFGLADDIDADDKSDKENAEPNDNNGLSPPPKQGPRPCMIHPLGPDHSASGLAESGLERTDDFPRDPEGLVNIGNSCYINAAIQLLLGLIRLNACSWTLMRLLNLQTNMTS